MSGETPWSLMQRLHVEGQPFSAALPGLQEHGLTGEDVGALISDPSSELATWLRAGTSDERSCEPNRHLSATTSCQRSVPADVASSPG